MKAVKKKTPDATLLGLGLDAEDGHTRLTRGKNFLLAGGSEETHSVMQETAIKVNEHLDRKGQRMEDLTAEQLRDICESIRR